MKGKRIQLIKRISINDPPLLRKFKLNPFPHKTQMAPRPRFESHAGHTVFGQICYPILVILFRSNTGWYWPIPANTIRYPIVQDKFLKFVFLLNQIYFMLTIHRAKITLMEINPKSYVPHRYKNRYSAR